MGWGAIVKDFSQEQIHSLEDQARGLRREIIKMLGEAGSGHTGGSLGAADIVAVLYFWEMNLDPARPDWEDRDRFVLSKGHAAPLLYAALASRGYFPLRDLSTLRKLGSPLQGHPSRSQLAGVEASTGSLGQGISWAVGMALAGKMDEKDYRVYTLLGDGELEEGMVWEAAMAAAHYRLDNLVAFIDFNGLQIDGPIEKVLSPLPIPSKFAAFGWEVLQIDGHDLRQIMQALDCARLVKGKPTAIVARTTKGKGCSFMENQVDWHGVAPKGEEIEKALVELGENGA